MLLQKSFVQNFWIFFFSSMQMFSVITSRTKGDWQVFYLWPRAKQNLQNTRCSKWRLRSACTSAQSDQSSLGAVWVAKDLNPSCGQLRQIRLDMHRLICQELPGHTSHFVDFGSLKSILSLITAIWAGARQNQQNDLCARYDSEQPIHSSSLIRVFAFRMKKLWVLVYLLSVRRRLWSD